MTYNILIVGVGGQGTLLASRVLGNYAVNMNYDCKLSEVHGMSQRGGSVETHVRIGDEKILAPIVPDGGADIIVSFEKLEALRWRHYLKKGGVMVVNDTEIAPMPVIIGAREYPKGIIETIETDGIKTIVVKATDIAIACGNAKAANVVMLGALAKNMGFDYDVFADALVKTVPAKFVELNKKAFAAGYAAE